MGYLEHVRSKIRHDPFPRIVLDALAKVGMKIRPYCLLAEGLFAGRLPHLEEGFEVYELRYLGPKDMKSLASIPHRPFSEGELLLRLREGRKCFAAVHRGEIAAFTWFDTSQCHFWAHRFPLKSNEAYLFDAFTLGAHRGKSLAPYLRYQLYKELNRLGRDTFYSVSDRFNVSSIRFKEKLNARMFGRGVAVELFSRWRFATAFKQTSVLPD